MRAVGAPACRLSSGGRGVAEAFHQHAKFGGAPPTCLLAARGLARSLSFDGETPGPRVVSSSSPSSSSALSSSPSCPAHRHAAWPAIQSPWLPARRRRRATRLSTARCSATSSPSRTTASTAAMLRDGGDYRKTHAYIACSRRTHRRRGDARAQRRHVAQLGLGSSPTGPHGSSTASCSRACPASPTTTRGKAALTMRPCAGSSSAAAATRCRSARAPRRPRRSSRTTPTCSPPSARCPRSPTSTSAAAAVHGRRPHDEQDAHQLRAAARAGRIASTALALEPIDVYDHFARHCNPTTQYWCDGMSTAATNDAGHGHLASKVAESLYATCPDGRPQQVVCQARLWARRPRRWRRRRRRHRTRAVIRLRDSARGRAWRPDDGSRERAHSTLVSGCLEMPVLMKTVTSLSHATPTRVRPSFVWRGASLSLPRLCMPKGPPAARCFLLVRRQKHRCRRARAAGPPTTSQDEASSSHDGVSSGKKVCTAA